MPSARRQARPRPDPIVAFRVSTFDVPGIVILVVGALATSGLVVPPIAFAASPSTAATGSVSFLVEERDAVQRLGDAVGKRDARGIRSAMDGVLAAFDALPEKDRRGKAKLAGSLGKLFGYRDPRDGTIPMRAADVLGMMGDAGADVLRRELRQKKYEKEEDLALLREAMILALGRTGSPTAVDTLLGYLEHHDAGVATVAVQGLAGFAEAPGKIRKRVVAEVIRALQVAQNQGRGQRPRPGGGTSSRTKNDQSRSDRLMGPAHTTLVKLTGVSLYKTADWDTWFRENKRRDWDKKEDD